MRFFGFVISLAALVLPSAALQAAEKNEKYTAAQDLWYGASLFEYYQGNHFNALSKLMVAQERGQLPVHGESAELIEGGLSLEFGLDRRAAELFQKQFEISSRQSALLSRFTDNAWLNIADHTYREGLFGESYQFLERISGRALDDPERREVQIRLNLLLKEGKLETAERLIQTALLPNEAGALAYINLGGARARVGNFAAATISYRKALDIVAELDSAEARVLQDKANMGNGFALALMQQYMPAVQAFQAVRLNTPWSEKAMLGLAWAAASDGEYLQAAGVLKHLTEREALSVQVQEALFALPYSYEKLKRPNLALAAYRRAAEKYSQGLRELEQLEAGLREAEFEYATGPDGSTQTLSFPSVIVKNHFYLSPVLLSDTFRLQYRELQNLLQMQAVVQDWQEKLPFFADNLREREARRERTLKTYESAQFDAVLDIQEKTLKTVLAEIKRINESRDYFALVDDVEMLELLSMVDEAEARYEKLAGQGAASEEQLLTIRRARGILLWNASEAFSERSWQARKQAAALISSVQEGRELYRSVKKIAETAPSIQQKRTQIQQAESTLRTQEEALAQAIGQHEKRVRAALVGEVQSQAKKLRDYLGQSQLAIARIYDASQAGGMQ
ncbi:hypothetical protein [Biformimicrobium ophioploci]|uniref:Tetratricopeptide repeat protein n=1 Tax=Biformimicrobium ophioploci TaxID=3036711 RepID=A0ABQ6M175_9GAMM|nr:hypothetical protein [Microbulbifer sp. NKW57]GMG88086.1 hypothetical protein MNKW57_24070 [Microbulbifer sp. NKW57]